MLKKIHDLFRIPNWLFIVLFGVILFRIPNFFEPYSYGDETIYLTLGQAVRKGFTLYKDFHDNKPPLLYLTAAVAGNLFWFKTILLLFNILGITLFYKFSEKLFPKIKYLPHASTIVFSLLTTLPFLEGNIANAENFMIFPTLAAFYILLFKKLSRKNLFFAGVLFSISSLYKIPAIFDFPTIILFWLFTKKLDGKNIKIYLKNTFILVLGISIPILISFIYYTMRGAMEEYLVAAYLQNFGYLSSWRPDSQKDPFFEKNAPLLIRGALVFIINAFLYIKRRKIDHKFLFLCSWLSLTVFGITLSERPYPHYLLQSAAPLSLIFALLLTSKSMLQIYAVLPLTFFFFVPLYFRFWHYRPVVYYTNFVSLLTKQTNTEEYLSTFGGKTISNYEISGIVNTLTGVNDTIFVWEDSSQIYALSNRLPPIKYVAGYHINDFYGMEQTISDFLENPPSVVVILSDSSLPDSLKYYLKSNYLLYKESSKYQIWKNITYKSKVSLF